MPTLRVFSYNAGSTLRATWRELLFRAAISEYCPLMLMAFLLWALIGAPCRVRKKFPGVVDPVSKGVLFPICFSVREVVNGV